MRISSLFICVIALATLLGMSFYLFSYQDDGMDAKTKSADRTDAKEKKTEIVKQVIVHHADESRMDSLLSRLEVLEDRLSVDGRINSEENENSEQEISPEELAAMEEKKIADMEAMVLKKHKIYEEKMNSDIFDREWDNKMQRKIEAVLNENILASVTDYSFICRSFMCKLETNHEGEDTQDEFLIKAIPSIMRQNNGDIDGVWQMKDKDGNGQIKTYIYFFRKGTMKEIEESV